MKKIGMVLILGFSAFMHAENVLYLDETLINQEIKSIMRSRGIEPDAHLIFRAQKFLNKFCEGLRMARKSRMRDFLVQDRESDASALSISDLYAKGFRSLAEGNLNGAIAAWSLVGLHYPILDEEKHMVETAINFLGNAHKQPFPVLKICIPNRSADTNIILLPLASPILLSAFFLG